MSREEGIGQSLGEFQHLMAINIEGGESVKDTERGARENKKNSLMDGMNVSNGNNKIIGVLS